MSADLIAAITLDDFLLAKRAVPLVLLVLFWSWETWRPFFDQHEARWKHAGRNLVIALCNTTILGLVFGSVTLLVTAWTEQNQLGLLNTLSISGPFRFLLALLLLDGWMYLWHRANHTFPILWRFHRMHHSDRQMDVTTATRFHLGEHIGSSVLKLGLIPLLGFEVWHLVVYDTLVIAITQFHHANISLGRWDRWLRFVIVTPDIHKIHHSDWRAETDSNYATVLSIWDRLAGSFRMRANTNSIVFGLAEFTDASYQTVAGMLKTPFVNTTAEPSEHPSEAPIETEACVGMASNHIAAH